MLVGFEGIPGSGKSTILRHLGPTDFVRYAPLSTLYGQNDSWKSTFLTRYFPWGRLWEDPARNCEAFLRWRGQMIRETCALRPIHAGALFMEGSVLPNYMAMALKEMGHMSKFGLINFLATELMNTYHTDFPDFVIVIRTSPDLALERLIERDLPGDKLMPREFLIACHDALQDFLQDLPPRYADRVFVVDNNVEPENFPEVVQEIRNLYPRLNDSRQARADIDLQPPTGPIGIPNKVEGHDSVVYSIYGGGGRIRQECNDCRLSCPLMIPEGWTGLATQGFW